MKVVDDDRREAVGMGVAEQRFERSAVMRAASARSFQSGWAAAGMLARSESNVVASAPNVVSMAARSGAISVV